VAAQEIEGIEHFPGDAAARESLDRHGFVVLSDVRLVGADGPMRQTFDPYLGHELPLILTADAVLDAVDALAGRVLVDAELELDPMLGEAVEAFASLVESLPAERSALLRTVAAAARELRSDPRRSVEDLLVHRPLLAGALPIDAVRLSTPPPSHTTSPQRATFFRVVRLFQLVRLAGDSAERAAFQQALADGRPLAVRYLDAAKRWIGNVRRWCGTPTPDSWLGAEPAPALDRSVPLLPMFDAPLGRMWRDAGARRGALSGIDASFTAPSGRDPAIAWQLADALRELDRPAANAAEVFASAAWRTLHANTRAATLAATQAQCGLYAGVRLRGIPANDHPFVVPFPGLFERLGEVVRSMRAFRAALATTRVTPIVDVELAADLERAVQFCGDLAAVARQQLAASASSCPPLDEVGVTLARLHGYHGEAWMMPRDDHARTVELGATVDDRSAVLVGRARPELLFVVVPKGGKRQLHVGAVLAYRESAVSFDRVAEAMTATWTDDAVPTAFRGHRGRAAVTSRR